MDFLDIVFDYLIHPTGMLKNKIGYTPDWLKVTYTNEKGEDVIICERCKRLWKKLKAEEKDEQKSAEGAQ